jgi:hypothetical protein
MSSDYLLSPAESKFLRGFILLLCLIFTYNLLNKAVDKYNEEVRWSQERNERRANNPNTREISFGIYDISSGLPLWYLLYGLQFFTTPFSYFLLKKQKLNHFVISTFFTFLTFASFSAWTYDTFSFLKYEETTLLKDKGFNQYILYDSTLLEFVLFLSISALLIVQISILLRFVIEKFPAKISLK